MPNTPLICRIGTTFAPDLSVDEEAFRAYLQRFIEQDIGVYVASGASGEGHALTLDECGDLYRIAVDECHGKVLVGSNGPEQHTPALAIAHAQLAAESQVDVCSLYGPAGLHGYRPTDEEYSDFFDIVLREVHHPIALCPNPVLGYTPKASTVAKICERFTQVESVNLSGLGDSYFVQLRDALTRDVDIFVAFPGSLNMLMMGAAGIINAEANFIPKTFRTMANAYTNSEFDRLSLAYADARRATDFLGQWKGSSPRWIKLAMMAFDLPGGAGGLRPPYRSPSEADAADFRAAALRLGIDEVEEMARSLGQS